MWQTHIAVPSYLQHSSVQPVIVSPEQGANRPGFHKLRCPVSSRDTVLVKRFFLSLLASALLFTCVAATAPYIRLDLAQSEHDAAHWIVLDDGKKATDSLLEQAGCTATAIGPHTLVSAHHCWVADSKLFLDGNKTPHEFQAIFDSHDTMLLVVPDVTFTHLDTFNPRSDSPVQGETVHFYGNPGGVLDQYRTGYITGHTIDTPDGVAPEQILWIAAAPVIGGDSGSLVLDTKGQVLGVLTYGIAEGKFFAFFSPTFTQAQLRQAGL